MAYTRPEAAPIKIVCLGLGRTGTSSLRDALELLGFGPCYHWTTIVQRGGKDFSTWSKIGDGNGAPEDFDSLFRGHSSVADYPVAMYGAELYSAYPNAKFILTTRDPAKWEKSMKSTILWVYQALEHMKERNELQEAMAKWSKVYCEEKYHGGRIYTHAQQEFLDHNERVQQIIPPEKLLVYDVAEGWDRLVQFLGVPKPETPFPHVNDTAQYQQMFFPMYIEVEGKAVKLAECGETEVETCEEMNPLGRRLPVLRRY